MAVLRLRFLVLILSISLVQCRTLRLNSSDDLISDGIDHLDDQSPVHSANVSIASASTCQHQYGFLPCAENAGGYIFQIVIYQGLLIFGETQLNTGTKLLFNILGTGKIVGIIFRILVGLPAMSMMIVSGIFSSKEDAQSTVSLGVGIFAGITVFTLTIQWGICLIFGRRKLPNESISDHTEKASATSNCLLAKEVISDLKDTGVKIDKETRYIAGIMLLSLIPYIIVQLADIFKITFGSHLVILIALVVSSVSLLLYFAYQVMNPWIQQRSLDYSKYEILRTGFLQHMQRHGNLIDEDGKLNFPVIRNLFSETDKDADKSITKGEMERLMLEIIETGDAKVDKQFAVTEVMKVFDFNDDEAINYHEFVDGCKKWIAETKQLPKNGNSFSREITHEKKEDDPEEIDRIMSKILIHAETRLLKAESLITEDGNPNIEGIKNLFKQFDLDNNNEISKTELEQLIRTVKFGEFKPNYEDVVKELFNDFDKDGSNTIDEPEFVDGLKKWVDKAIHAANSSNKAKIIDEYDKILEKKLVHGKSLVWTIIKSVLQVLLGIVILTFIGGPLMGSILQLSHSMSIPSFGISFVIVPLAMNARTAIAAIFPASHKSEKTASLTFSEIYGGVVMSNISNLTTLLAIVYVKDLSWNYSAEILTVLVVCAMVGILAYSSSTYPLWTCLLAFFLYPFSLGLFYYAQFVLRWN